MSFFGSTLYWIAGSFECVGFGHYGFIAVFVLVVYLSLYTGLTCYLTKQFTRNRISFIIFFPIFWTICEYLRGWVFTGFPWNLAGYIAYDIPYFAQIADIIGAYGVSFLLVLSISLITYKKTIIYGACTLLIPVLYGVYKVEYYDNYIIPEHPDDIVIVQPSIRQIDKMDRHKSDENLERHLDLSKLEATGKRLIIWPEAGIDCRTNDQGQVSESIEQDDVFIITGIDRMEQDRTLFNSLKIIGKDVILPQTYDKRHLLPFGEFIPEFLMDLGVRKLIPGVINYSSGTQSRAIKLEGFAQFDVIICYEVVFPGEVVDDPDSQWILNITNDAWFGDSDGPSQHLKAVCFRAIEEGKAIARCANNGISCVIDCHGQVRAKLDTDVVGRIETRMPLKYHQTFFSTCKNSTILIVLLLTFLFTLKRKRRWRSRRREV
jgi:apolipoprotein N-acyltransferase